jgi:predicted MFS family arabinose efflux permease
MGDAKVNDEPKKSLKASATKFVLMVGIMSLFADFTYEGSRSIVGPYLGFLGLGAAAISIITGLGELLGYSLRLFSGRAADSSKKFWPITIFGYVIQMVAVPLLAVAGYWPLAAWLIIQERMGKATRNPPRDVMLSHAAKEMGYGWAFGVHEALDQTGAMIGPLVVAALLAMNIGYPMTFAFLAIPAAITLTLLMFAWRTYPHPEHLESSPPDLKTGELPRVYWVYLAGAVLVGAGIGGFPLIAYHLQTGGIVSADLIPVFYAIAMGVGGLGSLVFGRLLDRVGMSILILLTVASALALPLVWLGGFSLSLVGVALWGLGIGVQESLIPAIVATMVPRGRRASAYGIFTAGYGISLFVGSVFIGLLYEVNLHLLIAFGVTAELAAIPVFLWVAQKRQRNGGLKEI